MAASFVRLLLFPAAAGWLVGHRVPQPQAPRFYTDVHRVTSAGIKAGFDNFVRTNPRSGRFEVTDFHHVEFYCSDATSAMGQFCHALGMQPLAKSDPSTGNLHSVSHCIGSGDVRFVFTAPTLKSSAAAAAETGTRGFPGFDADTAHNFVVKHGGMAVRAVCIEVSDVDAAFASCLSGGGEAVLQPCELPGDSQASADAPSAKVAEVKLYGDVVLRLLSLPADGRGQHLPGWVDVPQQPVSDYSIHRIDHVVGNVWNMDDVTDHIKAMTGFHEFAEFTSEDVGTIDSGLNSMVLASNNERVLLPVNEPTFGTRRRSQIETYLINHDGEGVQHIALFSKDIFTTIRAMREAGARGGFSFLDRPSDAYYAELPERIGDAIPPEMLAEAEELGLLVDRDDQGTLLQVFTRPVGDRTTLFLEIIQRVGCMVKQEGADAKDGSKAEAPLVQKAGCGGFGKGNFKELFKSVEDYEKRTEAACV